MCSAMFGLRSHFAGRGSLVTMLRHMNMLVAANIDLTCQPLRAEMTEITVYKRSLLDETK